MDAVLAALVALMALAAAMAAVLSTLSKAAIFALLAIAPCVYRYRKRIYVIAKTLPRDLKFLWRYVNGIVRQVIWGKQDATVASLFTKRAARTPDAPCFIVVGDRTWTYKEMAAKSNQVSRVMQEHIGLKRGDVVCVFMPNCAEYVWTWLGMAKLGAVSALINSNLRHKPLLHCIQVAKAKAIVFSDQLADAVAEIRDQLPADTKLFQLYGTPAPGVLDFGAEMERHPPDYPLVSDPPHYKDTLLYIYTSGTTGMPKAAVLPNSKLLYCLIPSTFTIFEPMSSHPNGRHFYRALWLTMYGAPAPGVLDFGAEMERHPPDYPLVSDPPHYKDTLLYIYTSGTTGMPKAAVLPNSKYLLIVLATVHMLGLKSWDRMYNSLPMYHTAGGVVGTGAALVEGIPSIIRPRFSASNFWTDCIKYQCTVAQYIGEMCRYLLAQPPRATDAQHRVRIMVGNGMRPAIWQSIVDRFKVPQINEIYGATEGNANIINVDNTVGAVGFLPKLLPARALPIAVVRVDEHGALVRGPDSYCIRCDPGEPGMFIGLISQGNASREYYGYVDKTDSNKKLERDVFRKGDAAFVSGDLLVGDELGYLYFRDRTGDTYRWKGENVSTGEVENALGASAAIANREAVVYGVSIPQNEGRAGMAAIADPARELDLARLARDLDDALPSYARPLFLRIVKDIDITSTFKLKKLQYQKEGFDPDVIREPLYFRAGADFVPITSELFKDICNGRVKL